MITDFPHSDHKVLHAPGVCESCDMHPEWQQLRQVWGIAFTGRTPGGAEALLPCPSDFQAWQGERPAHHIGHWLRHPLGHPR